jgi:16S rRNA (adenine1518-N6/adenine1519-N6)-dimethyltransferase
LNGIAKIDLRSEARRWFRTHHLHPQKSRGQHFMVSTRYLFCVSDAAASLVYPCPNLAIEVGPGLGFLTRFLMDKFERVLAVEVDLAFVEHLRETFRESSGLQIVGQDFLKFPLAEIPEPFILVGNLPYNLSTPVLEQICGCSPKLRGVAVVLQKEFGERAAATVGSRHSGRLSLLVQNHFEATLGEIIPASAFYPRPKVASRLLLLLPRDAPLIPPHLACAFDRLVRAAFSARRKMIRSALSSLLPPDRLLRVLERSGIPGTLRPESLSFSDWMALSSALYEMG